MSIRKRLAIALMTFLVPVAFAGTASAQAGAACSGTICGLGGQIRGQIGDGLPLPISIAPARTGAFSDITIQTLPATPSGLSLVGNGLGQPGQIKPTTNATIMQTIAAPHTALNPRQITLAPENFHFDIPTQGSIGVLAFNTEVLAVQTDLVFDNPHPGTDGLGNVVVVPGGGGSRILSANGRAGRPTVTFCALGLAGGTPGNNFGGVCVVPADGVTVGGAGVNGIVRFTKTKNQFGGTSTGRTLGTAQVYFNVNNLTLGNLPCNGGTNPACAFGISTVIPGTTGVAGGPFGGTVNNLSFMKTPGIFTGSIGFNGSILSVGAATPLGLPFTGQPATSVGFPLTTGRITISVTDALPVTEKFIRTGTDARDADGNGVVALNTGNMSARTTSRGNSNRTWVTLEIPEPSAIFAASAGLFALFGCHQLVRRRFR
ncbi:MAG: hypothetical protein O6922_00720 [Chloroflexi bacterium]|nr:hypothetical protein [Chloroflexota bacterium]